MFLGCLCQVYYQNLCQVKYDVKVNMMLWRCLCHRYTVRTSVKYGLCHRCTVRTSVKYGVVKVFVSQVYCHNLCQVKYDVVKVSVSGVLSEPLSSMVLLRCLCHRCTIRTSVKLNMIWRCLCHRCTVRTSACWPNCFWTTRRCTLMWNPSFSTLWPKMTTQGVTLWATSQRCVKLDLLFICCAPWKGRCSATC